MAIKKALVQSILQLRLETGKDAQGRPLISKARFKGLNPAIAPELQYAGGTELAGLSAYPLKGIHVCEEHSLTSEQE